jgi:hypothetical protein
MGDAATAITTRHRRIAAPRLDVALLRAKLAGDGARIVMSGTADHAAVIARFEKKREARPARSRAAKRGRLEMRHPAIRRAANVARRRDAR